ncbi:MAG: hypothetical protein IPG80_16735 [Anaerolineales bacterium]|uniref:hypothetical protein n=1 Tax=Candidatus Villigracilis vicinus TaxID=3140679 RepID=UPI00313650E1|nr:hypothetical protein [Anaerolineales bacterium]MBK7451683.1 hypothetical protein [Anaerolineales bacterium]
MAIFKKYYSRQGLWTLFLICALPLHLWALFLSLRDFDWITARTNSWDAVGVVSYGLLFAFLESLAIFALAALLGFLISNKWIENKRVALMGTFVIVLSFWSILNQTYFLRAVTPSGQILSLFAGTGRPLIALYITALFLIGLTVILPTYFILRSEKAEKIVLDGFERFSLLMTLYLFFDFIALVIVLVRNF